VKRAPIVLGSTAVGLGLVLSFHTHGLTTVGVKATGPSTSIPATGPTSAAGGTTPSTLRPGSKTPGSTTPASTQSATGNDIGYRYGDIQLKVTRTGKHITLIDVVQNGAVDPRSAQINSIAVPMLTTQALDAQSSQIDGISGASFTSAAYSEALQSALDQLKA
jgi:uncharacterized protein with FMN-binding domain